MDKEPDLTDEELLALPDEAVPPDSILWTLRSEALHRRALDNLNYQLNGTARATMLFHDQDPKERQRREEKRLSDERTMREITDRQNRLLMQIEGAQRVVDERRRQIEDNAIRLRDGRRVYVDGDRYRDEEGRVLTGEDEAEAAREHEQRPNASTWEQKREVERQAEELRRQKERILMDKGEGLTPEEASRRMDGYEKEFAEQAAARQREMKAQAAPVDYGSADYMSAFGDEYQISTKPAFAAASTVTRETEQHLTETETESATADNKKAPRPSGQGAPKLG